MAMTLHYFLLYHLSSGKRVAYYCLFIVNTCSYVTQTKLSLVVSYSLLIGLKTKENHRLQKVDNSCSLKTIPFKPCLKVKRYVALKCQLVQQLKQFLSQFVCMYFEALNANLNFITSKKWSVARKFKNKMATFKNGL